MRKKLLSLILCLAVAGGLAAQIQGNNRLYGRLDAPAKGIYNPGAKTLSITPADIQWWTGTGNNQAIFIIGFDDDPSGVDAAFAYGVRWNGSAVAMDLLDTIAAYDSRFSYTMSGSLCTSMSITYQGITYGSSINYWCYYINGDWALATYDNQAATTGDVFEVSSSCTWSNTSFIAMTDPATPPAATDATIAASDILYWLGSGSSEAILAVNWNSPDTCLAWGFRFNGTTTVKAMMDTIAAHDPRFSYVPGSWGIDDILYAENGDTLRLTAANGGNYWWSNINGTASSNSYDTQAIADGDLFKWGDPTCGIVLDTMWGYPSEIVWTTAVTPVSVPDSTPAVTDATIAASSILYWLGSGNSEAILAVNWNNPDTCLAWGFRFNGTATVKAMMDTIAAHDPRFSYVPGSWGIDDILYAENGDTLRLTAANGGNYWLYNLNGSMSMLGYDLQEIENGDFVKWGDPTCGIVLGYDEWGYPSQTVWTTAVTPVAIPSVASDTAFCGAVGTPGCTAISCLDNRILNWASACTVVRGSSDLSNPEAAAVTYGVESDAIGAATESTMDVVSLGDGGTATLTFNVAIANGEGYDFAVFENSFDDHFLELGFVEVSSDGEHFVRFPSTSLTQTDVQINGTGSLDPTNLNNFAGKYRAGWGTPFDLEELRDSANLDINAITHVRIIDVVGSIDPALGTRDAFGHMVNDPFPTQSYSGGFDLDGVAVLHEANTTAIAEREPAGRLSLYPNPANNSVSVSLKADGSHTLAIYDMTGRQLLSRSVQGSACTLDLQGMANGIYLLRVDGEAQRLVVRH